MEKEHYPLCRDLMRLYKDLPMDLADATMVVLAEALGISKIFTLDHKDFSIYRFKQTRRFTLIPPKLRQTGQTRMGHTNGDWVWVLNGQA